MAETDIYDVHMVTYVCLSCGEEFSTDVSKSINFELVTCSKCDKKGNFKLRNISVRKEARRR